MFFRIGEIGTGCWDEALDANSHPTRVFFDAAQHNKSDNAIINRVKM